MHAAYKILLAALFSATFFQLRAESLLGMDNWSYRVRSGAVGKVDITAKQVTVSRNNDAGEIILVARKFFPATIKASYRFSIKLIGPAGGQVLVQAPPSGGNRRPFPSSGFVDTTGKEQTITIDLTLQGRENGIGTAVYFTKPGNYVVTDITLDKTADPLPDNEFIASVWDKRIRGGAVGSVEYTPRKITVIRKNADGEVIVLKKSELPVLAGATYKVTVKLTGPAGGQVIVQAPSSGGGRRSYPSSGYVSTTGKEQEISFDVALKSGENRLGITMYFVKPGTYTVTSVTISKTAEPVITKLLPEDSQLVNAQWRLGFHGQGAGEKRHTEKELFINNYNTFGSGMMDMIDRVSVKPETRYRLYVDVLGTNSSTMSATLSFFGKSTRTQRSRWYGCNGDPGTFKFDFTTRAGESEMSLSFLFNIGKFQITSIRLGEIDSEKEFAEAQKEFMLIWQSGKVPQEDKRFSRDFSFDGKRFFGKLAILLKKAFPSRKLKFTSAYTDADNVKAEIVARDIHKRELLRVPVSSDGVLLPENAAYTYLELTAPAVGAEYRDFEVRENISAPEAFHWRRWNSFEVGSRDKKAHTYRTIVKLDRLPVGAIGRFCTPGDIRVNDQSFGTSATGDTVAYYRNILPALKIGENMIYVDIPANRAQSLQADILLGFADGTHRVLRSDDGSWQMCETGSDIWQKVPVKMSTYRPSEFSQRWISPGEIPDAVVPKVNFSGKAVFARNSINAEKSLPVTLELDLESWMFLGVNRFDISVVDSSGKKHWRQTVFGGDKDLVKGVTGKLKFTFDLYTGFLPVGEYHLETPEYLLGKIDGKFTVTKAFEQKHQVAVDYNGFLPMFSVNGKKYPVTIYRHGSRFKIGYENYFLQDFWRAARFDGDVRFHIAAAEMGPDMHKNIGVCSGEMWIGPGKYDFGIMDRMLENILAVDPESNILLNINMDSPGWYVKQFPDTRVIWHDGEVGKGVSWASERWRKDSAETVRAMMKYLAAKPYASRICGVFFSGGYDGQWWHHLNWRFPFKLTDYHPDMLNRFRGYLRTIYKNDVDVLRKAWCNQTVTFENAQLPTFEQRRGRSYYMDPAHGDRQVLDFIDAQAMTLKTHLEELFAAVKSVNNNMLAGSYYVPNWDCSYRWGQSQRQMTDSMLESPVYDFGASPMAYIHRTPEKIGHPRFGRNQYYTVNKKLELAEDDNRTFKFSQMPVLMWGNYTPADCVDTMRRNYAQRLSLGGGVWYYDIFGSFFDDPVLTRIIREEQILWSAANEFPALPELNASAATLRQIGTFNHRRLTTNNDLTQTHYWRRLEHFTYPVDDVFVNDLGKAGLPKYKLYLVDDLIALNSEQRKKINALKCNGNVLVFHHAAGYSNWKELSAKNISDLIGINVVESHPGKDLSDMAWRFADSKHPLLKGIKPGTTALRKREYEAKRFEVKDPGAVALGHYLEDGAVASAVKNHGDWTAVYMPTRLPPFAVQENFAAFAGVHSFTDASVALRAGGRFISAYCTAEHTAGQMKLPKKFALYDILKDQVIAPVDKVDFDLYRGELKLWFVGTEDEVKRFAEMVKTAGFWNK